MKKLLLIAVAIGMSVNIGQCLPLLQLDIGGGNYNSADETVYANANQFDLYALYNGTPSGTFYISAAIQPKQNQANPPPNVGTFTINGVTYSTSGMNWGLPPVAVVDGAPGVQDLGPHDIYPTYYAEIAFEFDSQVAPYNTSLQPGGALLGTGMYSKVFNVDVSDLLSSYSIHFDLYDVTVKSKTGNYTLDNFAPFSHDAQSGHGGDISDMPQVPDGGFTISLLGAAMLGIGAVRRKLV